MAYDEELAARVREVLGARERFDEVSMFGGVCFMVRGNMAVGVAGEELMARVGSDQHEAALAKPGARPMDFTHRPMKGFVFVGGPGIRTKRAIESWVDMALAYAGNLPPKTRKKKAPKGARRR